MKYLIITMVSLMLLLPAAMGNTVTQSNFADAFGKGQCGTIYQEEYNAALVIGQNNVVTQTNDQYADSWEKFGLEQVSANMALAFGTNNTVTQTNKANAFGGHAYQEQLNAVVVLGHENTASQENNATAFEYRVGKGNMIIQDQTNLGLVIGLNNNLIQLNDAFAEIPKDCDDDPMIIQDQMNMAVLISKANCHEDPCDGCEDEEEDS